MVLSDRDIRRRIGVKDNPNYSIGIDPFDDDRVQPSSIDLTLADEFRVFPQPSEVVTLDDAIDLDKAKEIDTNLFKGSSYVLAPGELILFSTAEYIEIPTTLCARIDGKSSIGRLGLLVHCTAGFIDPGFKGKITLEMVNLNNRPIILRAGKPICQISFFGLSCAPEKPYGHKDLGSHYQNQTEVTASRYDG
jgi:dCTP deaminase